MKPTKSGEKFTTSQGFRAVKDGVRPQAGISSGRRELVAGRKPPWLRISMQSSAAFKQVKQTVDEHRLATVCEESYCPNRNECWSNGTATIMVLGSVCTRACRFCAVDTGNPGGWTDPAEPENCARSVKLMDLRYVVLTSVDRDDLPDGGAQHYADCVAAIKRLTPSTAVEALTPDFQGNINCVDTVVHSGLEVFAQNIETVERLTHPVRDPRAGYQQTLDVLAHAKTTKPGVLTKSSLMLGLGENDEEIEQCMRDLRAHDVDILTLGQYLQPTRNHLSVERWVHPDEFDAYRETGLALGFTEVAAGPLVRSSYRADRILEKNNLGLNTGDTNNTTQKKKT
ncbi:MAG: lipoyl synthase, partial [Pseudomonadales bacterium]